MLTELRVRLGLFYLNKNKDDYNKCWEELFKLRITDTDFVDGYFVITLRRPGVLIGVKGKNVLDLQAYLGVKIKIVEETSTDPYYSILPQDFDDFYWSDYLDGGGQYDEDKLI